MLILLAIIGLLLFIGSIVAFIASLIVTWKWDGFILFIFSAIGIPCGIWLMVWSNRAEDANMEKKVSECIEKGGDPDRFDGKVYCDMLDK